MSEPRAIGKYQITGLLGTGGQGQVHSAIDAELGREVAIKSLHRSQGGDAGTVSRFRGEAKSLARIMHSNITTLIDFFAVDDHLYMIMELVHGRTLDDILQQRGKGLGVRESLAIIAQAADGLGYAHQMGVIHRDIKPSNLMITDSGRAKLMDFGIARVRGSDRLTRAGSAVGTPLYMAPEQCMGADGDERSDIYSLAIVLYELISGAPPFQGKTDHQLAQAHIKTPPPPLVPRIVGVTPALEAAIMKALAKKPEQRFSTMRAFSEALGANALLSHATEIIKSHSSLTREGTASSEVSKGSTFTAIAIATAKSRAGAALRRFQALHPTVKGILTGLAASAVLAVVLLRPSTPVVPPVRQPEPDRYWKGTPGDTAYNRPPIVDSNVNFRQPIADTEPVQKKAPCIHNGTFAPSSSGCISSIPPVQEQRPVATDRALTTNVQPVVEKVDAIVAPPPIQAAITVPEPSLADLKREFDLQNFNRAFEIARKLARADRNGEGGDREAQFTLGRLYQRGVGGVTKDMMQALQWYERAAQQGYAIAQYQVGFMYWSGNVSSRHDCRALPWFQKAAAQNVPDALYSLGYVSESGGDCGVRRNIDEAARYYQMAADLHHDDAIKALKNLPRR